jgi:DNA modification methylase
MNDLFKNSETPSGPVECLGQTFPSDEARREHFLSILREKLKDPEFRKIEGFPIGTDEDILALSDPPYYTACPNPFIAEAITWLSSARDPLNYSHIEPFTADVSEGKNNPVYNAHSYHTKVPHKAIMRYLLHYTQPGDIVFDGFSGTGMTGVAAYSCGDRRAIEDLGYRVDQGGNVLRESLENETSSWKPFAKIGKRHAILNDLSPVASFITSVFNMPTDHSTFSQEINADIKTLESKWGWMYHTLHLPTEDQIKKACLNIDDNNPPHLATIGNFGSINYTVWSDIFLCPNCSGEMVFWDVALDFENGGIRDEVECPNCSSKLTKRNLERAWISGFDSYTNEAIKHIKKVPVLINYSIGRIRFDKKPDAADLAIVKKVNAIKIPHWVPTDTIPKGDKTSEPLRLGMNRVHHFYTHRNLILLSEFRNLSTGERSREKLFAFTSTHQFVNRLCRLNISNFFSGKGGKVDKPLDGTLYVPSVSLELNVLDKWQLRSSLDEALLAESYEHFVSTGSATSVPMPSNSVDYIFIDPPFGGNLMYSELNFLWESWLRSKTNTSLEAIENKSQGKTLDTYRLLMTKCFKEAYRILKPGRWMTVEFSNTQAAVWNAIQTSLQEAGFVVANVSAIDKKKGSFNAVTSTTAVKQDLVISAYKPNGGLEDRFINAGGNEDSAWDFVRTHLKYLPLVKVKDGKLEYIAERDPRIIFDRLVAWFVRHNFQIPMSSLEFQAGLLQRFSDRDGMVFLPEQVTEYDRKRIQTAQAPQMELFVADERSAIDWLTDFLKCKPSTYQEISPEFIRQLGAGWKKHEAKPELSQLLESNFLNYDSKVKDGHEVPSQIHSYLSSNWAEYRNLEKSDPNLKSKAADRWYVPDLNKAQELEKLREKSLLKEFEIYKTSPLRKLKEFRLEVLRAGFKFCWANRDYVTIMAVAKKIPDDVLQEDEKLLLWYDQAVTRMEDAT